MTTTGSGISPATDWAGQAGLARAWHRQYGVSSNLVDEARELADSAGVPDHAPHDRIIVTTGTWDLATQWRAQLGPAGRIGLPLSIRGIQLSVGLETARDHLVSRSACRCSFIRMAGDIDELADLDLRLTLAEPGLAKYLARQAIVRHELGRPGAQDLELSAWPPGARPETIGGASIVIDPAPRPPRRAMADVVTAPIED